MLSGNTQDAGLSNHPTPADFFRTIEDATGEDLDWFWRGWFYGTDACDISIDTVKHAVPDVNAVPAQVKDTTIMSQLGQDRCKSV